MFEFVKQIFISAMMFFSRNLLSVNSLKCISINNQECKVRLEIVNVNSDEPIFYPFNIKTCKCSDSCNNFDDPYTKMCVPNVVKNLNVKLFHLMSRTNEKRHIEWHETCKCRLDANVCNNKQGWNDNKCRCERKELINKAVSNKKSVWNPGNCECECDKSCNVGEYLGYESCKCRKKLVDKLIEECAEDIDKVKIAEMA